MLSKRLEQVALMVTKGNTIADIGTDHGYVPIYLIKNNICPKAYAMDINKGPIEIAKNNIISYGLEEQIIAIQSDGLDMLEPNKADTVIIAGMGGELIVNILEKGLEKLENCQKPLKELVLSPQKHIDMVRKYLMDNNWHIVDEKMLIDMNKFYTIIKAEKGKEEVAYKPEELLYGRILLNRKDEILRQFLEEEKNKFENVRATMVESNSQGIDEVDKILEYNKAGRVAYD